MFSMGVVGYSTNGFDEDEAILLLINAFDMFTQGTSDVEIVSGLTDLGIPSLAYYIAKHRSYKTIGIACKKAFEYDLFPVDEQIIVGDEWGDESKTFLNRIDVLIRVGGGKQSLKEVEMFKNMSGFSPEKLVEFELELEEE